MQRHSLINIAAIVLICFFLGADMQARSEDPYFGAIGEGYTAENLSQGIRVA